jgi:hypothetical protein
MALIVITTHVLAGIGQALTEATLGMHKLASFRMRV